MNSLYLYHQIFKGKWFIHYSYALSLAPVLNNLLQGKQMSEARDWRNNQTLDFEKSEERAKFPVQAGISAGTVSIYDIFDDAPEGSVALIPLKGAMMKYGTWCQYVTEEIASVMLRAASSGKIDAIILDIYSGGGTVDSIPPLLEAISKIQNEFNKPVVACADLCASAAYYVACHCDRIIAGNAVSSEFGSIGLMMQFGISFLIMKKEGFRFHSIYALRALIRISL